MEDKKKGSKDHDEVTDEELDKMMTAVLALAEADEGEEIDAVFDQLLSDDEASEKESIKIQDAIEAIAVQLADASDEKWEKLFGRLEEKLLSLSDHLNQTGIRGMIAMRILQIQAERNGLSDMSLEEINAEIDTARRAQEQR